MSVYVETRIRGTLDEVWRLTQNPDQHVRWDLRFSEIEYLPRSDRSLPQQFAYRTRMGGLTIEGHGETIGDREGVSGDRVSSLRFWSDDPKSLIQEGAGYWKYIAGEGSVRFLTVYDYRVRYGRLGRALDQIVFRPWMAWATAWSFDRLRLWIEKGIDPWTSLRMTFIHWLARLTVAAVWFYQGIVPKLWQVSRDELAMLADAGLSGDNARLALTAFGCLEVVLGVALLTTRHPKREFGIVMALMLVATMGVAIASPGYLIAAFNPISLNLSVAALAGIGWLSARDLPAAGNCTWSSVRAPR